MANKQEIKVITNPSLICAHIAFIIIMYGVSALMAVVIYTTDSFAPSDRLFSSLWLPVLITILVIVLIVCADQYYMLMVLKKDYIEFRSLTFGKTKIKNYSDFPMIYKAYYYHGPKKFKSSKKVFIIMTSRGLSQYELSHINQVVNADNLVKIKYTQDVYDKLCEVLPPRQLRKLKFAFNNNTGDGSVC